MVWPCSTWEAKDPRLEPLESFLDCSSRTRPWAYLQAGLTPLGKKWLANCNIVFHTDSAKAYKLKMPGVLHDSVVHQKKRVKKNGKWQWTKPNFVNLQSHKLPGGKSLKAKCGTQQIDRCWKFIKERLAKGTNTRAGSQTLQRKIRAAQYEYWHRGEDMWACTGELLRAYMSEIIA